MDKVASRLRLAEGIGATPVDYSKTDPVEQIKEHTGGAGTDKGIDAVGYQASVPEGQEQPGLVLNNLVETVRPTGRLGVVGLYVPQDPGPRVRRPGKASCCSMWADFSRRASRWAPARPTPRCTRRPYGI